MGKPKAVNFRLIPATTPPSEPYKLLDEAREWHEDLLGANIALAWRKNLKRNVDGQLILGKCIKVNDLQKEFASYDFIILLNKEVWEETSFTRPKKLALLDHELCHATVSFDKDFERRTDERGRTVYRVVKHDIEEFRSVVARHGCYKADLEAFAKALLAKKHTPVLDGLEPPKKTKQIEVTQ